MANADENYDHLRSYCALYRMELLQKYGLNFSMERQASGKAMHRNLVDLGFDMIFLPPKILNKYIEHISHATMVLAPSASGAKRVSRRDIKRIQVRLHAMDAQSVLKDSSLDL